MRRFTDLLKRFRRDERGAFAVIFALLAIVLIATSGAVVDFTYTQTARSRAQTALDSAALALQTKVNEVIAGTVTKADAEADIKTKAEAILRERLGDASIVATVNSATIDTTVGQVSLQASVQVPTAFVQLIGIKNITAQLSSVVVRGSKDLEISVALDTTGSMAGTKIADLKSATNTLIDLVIQPTQPPVAPTYSKMAIVPWSAAVNVGTSSYATGYSVDSVRGTPTPGIGIQSATWKSGSAINISGITKAAPGVVTTSTNHGLVNGDAVYITGVSGMTDVNDQEYIVHNKASKTFELYTTGGSKVDTRNFNKWTKNGTVQKCLTVKCEIRVTTSSAHGFTTGDTINITGVSGLSWPDDLNGLQTVGATTANTFIWPNTFGPDENAYSSGGTAYCTLYGCIYYYFTNTSGGHTLYQVNNCATERPTNSYDDTAPSTTKLNFNYTSGGSNCIGQTIQPLTSDKTILHDIANHLAANGSTAGHLGLAWGWYMVSPNFGYLWPAASQPGAYKKSNLVKAVILMTDGQFNLQYCNGVLSKDTGSGTRINCNSIDDSRGQAESLCDAIKADATGITLYTVGFDLGTDTASLDFLRDCATSPADFFKADTGTDLTEAFKKIAETLNKLRILH